MLHVLIKVLVVLLSITAVSVAAYKSFIFLAQEATLNAQTVPGSARAPVPSAPRQETLRAHPRPSTPTWEIEFTAHLTDEGSARQALSIQRVPCVVNLDNWDDRRVWHRRFRNASALGIRDKQTWCVTALDARAPQEPQHRWAFLSTSDASPEIVSDVSAVHLKDSRGQWHRLSAGVFGVCEQEEHCASSVYVGTSSLQDPPVVGVRYPGMGWTLWTPVVSEPSP